MKFHVVESMFFVLHFLNKKSHEIYKKSRKPSGGNAVTDDSNAEISNGPTATAVFEFENILFCFCNIQLKIFF